LERFVVSDMKKSRQKRFELRGGEQILARLVETQDGEFELVHELNDVQLRMLPAASLFDDAGVKLQIKNSAEKVQFKAPDGTTKLVLGKDGLGLLDARDQRAVAGLRVKSPGRGATSSQKDMGVGLVLELGPFEKLRAFRERVENLYRQIRDWTKATSVTIVSQDCEVNESIYGTYHLPSLEMRAVHDSRIANLIPIAASVLAAEGRVDLVGSLGREGFIYLASGGPQINVSARNGGSSRQTFRPLFDGVTTDGWYWISNARLSEVRLLDEILFKKMLRVVSDIYEI
jgi:hypothetical protein